MSENTAAVGGAMSSGDDEDDASPLDMDVLLEEILRPMVDHPQDVRVTCEEAPRTEPTGMDRLILNIYVRPTDRRLVIGRQGHTIQKIRALFSIYATRLQRWIQIEIPEPAEDRARYRNRNPRPDTNDPR